jgi:ADP-ribosylglycohydrolase
MKNFRLILLLGISVLFSTQTKAASKKAALNESEFRDKVYACWLGKNIGGTLGMPFEGKKELNNVTFYTKIKEGEPAANDDLDLQILWLKAMEENNCKVDAYTLGEYWLKYVPVNWNEYGVGKANMKLGIMPPLSGEYNNAKWKTSNGAWIRSEIWACLAPGNPMLAAEFAWKDACVDHGCAEGTYAEIFTATLESAAFVEKDMNKLIRFGLSMIPENCLTTKAIKVALESKNKGLDWKQAREEVVNATQDLGWFQAPRNVAFTLIGWLYGEGDFGESICIAINCGDDTDCTGATLGSIFGIIYGTSIIPEKWRAPIGDGIKTVAVSGFNVPANLQVLTDKTIAMQKRVAEMYHSPLVLSSGASSIPNPSSLLVSNKKQLSALWNHSPYLISRETEDLKFTCDYNGGPLLQNAPSKTLNLKIENKTSQTKNISFSIPQIPKGYTFSGYKDGQITIKPHQICSILLNVTPSSEAENAKFTAEINDSGKSLPMQLAIIRK